MENSLNYFFATYHLPQSVSDFSVKDDSIKAKIGLNINIPGKTNFVSFHIHSGVTLQKFSFNDNKLKVPAFLDPFANSISRVAKFLKSYKSLFFSTINEKSTATTWQILMKEKIEDVSFYDFLVDCENSFGQLLDNKINSDYQIDLLKEGKYKTLIFDNDFLSELKKDFNLHFSKIKDYLSDMENKNLTPCYTSVGDRNDLNQVIKEVAILKLNSDLNKELSVKLDTKKTAKI